MSTVLWEGFAANEPEIKVLPIDTLGSFINRHYNCRGNLIGDGIGVEQRDSAQP